MIRSNNRVSCFPDVTSPISLREGIKQTIASLGIEIQILENRVLLVWAEVVGEKISGETRVNGIKQGELFVSVIQSAWRHRLFFERESIRKKLNSKIGKEIVKSIHFGNFQNKKIFQ